MAKRTILDSIQFPVVIRRLFLSWLAAVTISYMVLSRPLQQLHTMDGVSQMSLAGMIVMLVIFFITITVIGHFQKDHKYERWLILAIYTLLSVVTLCSNFSWPLACTFLLLLVVLVVYALYGWQYSLV